MIGSTLSVWPPNLGPEWDKSMRPDKKFASNSMSPTCSEKSEVSKKLQPASWTKIKEFAQCSLDNPLYKRPKRSANFLSSTVNWPLLLVSHIITKIKKTKWKIHALTKRAKTWLLMTKWWMESKSKPILRTCLVSVITSSIKRKNTKK